MDSVIELFYCLNNNIQFDELISKYLSKPEIERASRFHFPKDKMLYINSHAFLNRELSKRTNKCINNLNISAKEFGKPFIIDNPFFFNLSHSNNSWSIGFCMDAEIGVDIEWIQANKNFADIISHYFSIEEQKKVMGNQNPLHKFYQIWTRKEAVLKALGVGLNYALNKIDVSETKVNIELATNKNVELYLETVSTSDVFISVAAFRPFKIEPHEITSINFESFFVD